MPHNVKDFEPIIALLEYSRRLTPALEAVLNGENIPTVCKKYHLNLMQLRHTLYQPTHRIYGKMTDPIDKTKISGTSACVYLTPWEKLYCDIFQIKRPALYAIPDNLDELMPKTFEIAGIIPHELEILNRLYTSDKTQADLAREDRVSRSSINQLLERAMAKLRKENVKHLLEYGVTQEETCAGAKEVMYQRYRQAQKDMQQSAQTQAGKRLDAVQDNINLAVRQHNLDAMKQLMLSLVKEIQIEQAKMPYKTPLDNTELPEDICRKLAWQNIHTVLDLYFMPDSILKIFTPKQTKILKKYLHKNKITLLTQEQACDLKAAMPELYTLEQVKDMNLPVRAITCLTKSGVTYRYQLERLTEDDLDNIPNLGRKTIQAIKPYLMANQIKSAT